MSLLSKDMLKSSVHSSEMVLSGIGASGVFYSAQTRHFLGFCIWDFTGAAKRFEGGTWDGMTPWKLLETVVPW